MAAKHMKIRKIVLSIITIAILTSQLAGCAEVKSDELMKMIDEGDTVVIELSVPADENVNAAANVANPSALDRSTLYNDSGFRSEFDKLFNINIVTADLENTKQGCMYTANVNDEDVQRGSSSLHTAYNNQAFMNYMNTDSVKNELPKLAEKVYTDVDSTSACATNASLNAYFDICREPNSNSIYNGSKALTRDQFATALMYSSQDTIKLDEVKKLGWLKESDGSLNSENKSTAITKIEAIYYLTNMCFQSEMSNTTLDKNTVVNGYKSAGDLATTIGAKDKSASKAWEDNTLAYMVKNPTKGLQAELMKSLVVANKEGILTGVKNQDIYSPVTKDEFMTMIRNTYAAENKAYGFKSTTEYGKLDTSEFSSVPVITNANDEAAQADEQSTSTGTTGAAGTTGTTSSGKTTTGKTGTSSTGSSSGTSSQTSGSQGKDPGQALIDAQKSPEYQKQLQEQRDKVAEEQSHPENWHTEDDPNAHWVS